MSKGDRVDFTATVEASKDDPKFGFYKRPTTPKAPPTAEQKRINKGINKINRIMKKSGMIKNGYATVSAWEDGELYQAYLTLTQLQAELYTDFTNAKEAS